MLLLEQPRKREEDFLEFLDEVHGHYPRGPVALLLDENSIHTSAAARSWAEDLNIQFLWLPKRSPHLNPMDQLSAHGKRTVCANLQQGSIEDQVDYFLAYYHDLSPTERLRKAGMFSPDFWLHKA